MSTVLSPSDLLEAVSEMDADDLDDLMEVIRVRRKHIADKVKLTLNVGDVVRFEGKQSGRWSGMWEGPIIKLNPKKAKIDARRVEDGRRGHWSIPYNLLERVED